jgi:hypothetical protein
MSANPLTEIDGVYSYDFTTAINQAYNSGQKQLSGGVCGLYGGDGNSLGTIDMDDISLIWKVEAGRQGYHNGDFNLDSQVNNMDKNEIWVLNDGHSTAVPE